MGNPNGVVNLNERRLKEVLSKIAHLLQDADLLEPVPVLVETPPPIAVSMNQGAQLLGISLETLEEQVWAGKLRTFRIGRRRLMGGSAAVVAGPTAFVALPAHKAAAILGVGVLQLSPIDFEITRVPETIREHKLAYGRSQRLKDYSLALEWAPMHPLGDDTRAEVVPGGTMGVRTDRWGDHPYEGFDTSFAFPWGAEDAELCLRAWRLGHTVVSVSGAAVAHVFRETWTYGAAGPVSLFNSLRLATLYLSDQVMEKVIEHYRNHPDLGWVVRELLRETDVAARRRELEDRGPGHLANLTPVFSEFGGLNVEAGTDRDILRGGGIP